MILSIGYENTTPAQLSELARRLDAVVVDVRGSTRRTKAGFGQRQLEALLGHCYEYRGDKGLGNMGANRVTTEGIDWLAERDAVCANNILLLCKEECPGDCHRHWLIALPLLERYGVDVAHICRDEVVAASELKRAIEQDADYESVELADFLGALESAA